MKIVVTTEISELLDQDQVKTISEKFDYFINEIKKRIDLINKELSKGLSEDSYFVNNTSPINKEAKAAVKVHEKSIRTLKNLKLKINAAAKKQKIEELGTLQTLLENEIGSLSGKILAIEQFSVTTLPSPEEQFQPVTLGKNIFDVAEEKKTIPDEYLEEYNNLKKLKSDYEEKLKNVKNCKSTITSA